MGRTTLATNHTRLSLVGNRQALGCNGRGWGEEERGGNYVE